MRRYFVLETNTKDSHSCLRPDSTVVVGTNIKADPLNSRTSGGFPTGFGSFRPGSTASASLGPRFSSARPTRRHGGGAVGVRLGQLLLLLQIVMPHRKDSSRNKVLFGLHVAQSMIQRLMDYGLLIAQFSDW